ncbi:hypothetical protein SLA2020_226120 [Shorea laevis]
MLKYRKVSYSNCVLGKGRKKRKKGTYILVTYLIGNWTMRSDNSYRGPEFEFVEEHEPDDDASSNMSDKDDDEDDPLELLESPSEDDESPSSMIIQP